jgi:hypothetical protein
MRCMRVILAGVRTGAVVAVAWMVLNAIYLAGVGLKQVVTWELGYHGQLICARAGGTTAIIWGMVAATVAGESWRSFGEVFGGAVVATCGATAGGFALVYVMAMAPQWQGPHFPGGLVAYLREEMGRSISKDRLSYTIPRRLALSQGR